MHLLEKPVYQFRGVNLLKFDNCSADDVPQNVKDFCARMMHKYNVNLGDNHPAVMLCEIRCSSQKWKLFRRDMWLSTLQLSGSSVIGGIDKETGEIFKSAGAATYAKGVRGNINSDQNGQEALEYDGHIRYLPKGRKAK